ncbi:hypothetical protein DH2020_004593 [Rehmannia glutinosa]|uniref:Uncharacterized protein n=1 Tax=Rehmannia glutinosa TaxID=99300 RepID=A0ABR0XPZ7_REHGL
MTSASAVSSVAERLESLLLAEGAQARLEGDLRDRVVLLRLELDRIASFLTDADRNEINVISREVTQKIKQLAYDIEDAVDSYVRQQEAAVASKGKIGGSIFWCLMKYCCFTEKSLREDLHIFKRRIDELEHVMRAGTRERSSGAVTSSIVAPEHHGLKLVPNHNRVLVGMGEDAESLKSLLIGGTDNLSVIAICGMGGVGKTTLAQYSYNNNLVMQYFENRAWATVSETFQARDILEQLLFCLGSERSKDEIARLETMDLMERLYKSQKGRRYLVVLDDIWSIEAWDTLKYAFPDDHNRSRIVITTRIMDLGRDMGAFVLKKQFLTDDQSWVLLKNKSGLMDDGGLQANPEIENIGKQIVRFSGGLPLALTVIGGILRGMNLKDWDVMLHKLQGSKIPDISGFERDLLHTLELSYYHLPSYLRPCFLYLGHFPPDEAISVEKLYLLWIGEGLISLRGPSNRTRMEVADNYFKELVDRSLVIVVEKEDVSASTRFKSFRVHDLIRDLCISKGKEEAFFEIIDFGHGNKISSLTRRLAIYLNKCNEDMNDALSNITEVNNIRSILLFDTDESLPKPTWPREFSDLKKFQGTRVLNFDGVDFRAKELLRGIGKLIYLRHLSFGGCYLQEFPSSFINFPFLETLDLRVRVSCIMTMPNVLNKLSNLRHLYFPLVFRSNTEYKLKLDRLRKLEILENFHAGMCEVGDLLQLENLQILTGIVDGNNMDLKNTITSMNEKKFLRHSSLVVKNFDSYSKEGLSVVATLLESNAIHALDIEGYLGVFPRHEGIGSNFTEMVFNGSEFSEQPMPILGKLPNLKSLVLCNDAFVGKEMVCDESYFPQLRSLKLATLQSLEKWTMKGDMLIMPSLTILTIEQCNKLEMLPYELSEIPTLQKIMIGSMPKEFQVKVMEFVEELRDLGSEQVEITFYDC